MKVRSVGFLRVLTAYAALAGLAASAALAASTADSAGQPYYKNKTIDILVESAPGGGTDAVARVTAQFLPKYIPGNPEIIVSNKPGAAGAVANAIFSKRAKPDGLQLIQNSTSAISMQLRKRAIAGYDLTQYKHIGNVVREQSVLLIKKGQRARLADPSAKAIQVGSKEGEEMWIGMVMFGKKFLGWNVRVIPGYGGTSEIEMAFRRTGEVEMFASSNAFVIRRMLEEGLAEVVASTDRRPDFPDIPTFEEVLGSKKPTGLPWQAYLAWSGPDFVDKFLSAPPGTPDHIVDTLVSGFIKMSKDPEFDKTVKKRISSSYTIYAGKQTTDILNGVLAASPETLAYLKELQRSVGITPK